MAPVLPNIDGRAGVEKTPAMTNSPSAALFSSRIWEDPALTAIGRLPMRATLYPFPDAEGARTLDRAKSPWFKLLNGDWRFRIHRMPAWRMWRLKPTAAHGRRSPCPATGLCRGMEARTTRTFRCRSLRNRRACQKSTRPASMPLRSMSRKAGMAAGSSSTSAGRRACFAFTSTDSLSAWGKDCRLPSEFDITDHVKTGGKNLLCAVAIKWSEATFSEDQDQWWMAGLHREVYLYSTAPVFSEYSHAMGNSNGGWRTTTIFLKRIRGFRAASSGSGSITGFCGRDPDFVGSEIFQNILAARRIPLRGR